MEGYDKAIYLIRSFILLELFKIGKELTSSMIY